MRKFRHIVDGKDCGTFEETNLEEAIEDVLRWHNIRVEEVFIIDDLYCKKCKTSGVAELSEQTGKYTCVCCGGSTK